MENVIQFIANYKGWQAIKKLTIEEKTTPTMIMEFLTSLGMSFDNRIENNLRKVVDLEKLDAVLNELEYGKSEEEIASALKAVNKRNVGAVIKEITDFPDLQKNARKELEQYCRVYAFKKALGNCGLIINYSDVDIPGMTRMKKKKV